jgi:hypothetical protein
MADHFRAIGFSFEDAGAMQATLDSLFDETVQEARAEVRGHLREHLRWRDESGASFAFHLEDKAIACVTPFFEPPGGLSRWRVRTKAALDDGDCAHCGGAECDILDADGELITRSAVQWLHYQPFREWLGQERTYWLEVAAFAHRVELFADEEDFRTSHRSRLGDAREPGGEPLRIAPEAFLPLGMFESGPDVGGRATALFSGRVEAASIGKNSAGGGPFWHVRVASLPGPIDVVAAGSEISEAPPPGAIALVEAWLVGRPAETRPLYYPLEPPRA